MASSASWLAALHEAGCCLLGRCPGRELSLPPPGLVLPALSSSKRRRLRAKACGQRLWSRTRWCFLDEEEQGEKCDDEEEFRKLVRAVRDEVMVAGPVEIRKEEENKEEEADEVSWRGDVQEMIDAAGRSQMQEIAGCLRDALGGVFKSSDLRFLVDKLDILEKRVSVLDSCGAHLRAVVARLDALEARRPAEGLRKRLAEACEHLANIEGELQDMDERLEAVECATKTFGGAAGDTRYLLGKVAEEEEEPADNCDEDRKTTELQRFREAMDFGWPVHLLGLKSRKELNGKAGFFGHWIEEEEKWEVRIGGETLLIEEECIVP